MPAHTTAFPASLVVIPLLVCLATAATVSQQPPQIPGAFRSQITLVPVDVRVLDKNGKPVTDLRRDEFIVLENNTRQEITQFATQALTAASPVADEKLDLRRAPGAQVTPRNRRIFLIVLGRGRLQHPGRNVDGLIDFVRQRLLPQDQAAVLAYNRASDFTTDHEKIATLIERFKGRHEQIEADLASHFSGLQAIYGSAAIPRKIQARIDEVFGGEGAPGFRDVTPGRITDADRLAEDKRRDTETLQRAEAAALKKEGGGHTLDVTAETDAAFLDMSLDQFAAVRSSSMQDLSSIYTGVEYMRFLEGEKHLIYVSERGMSLPRLENDKSVAALANDARVVIDSIYTGGVVGAPPPTGRGSSPLPSPGMVFNQTFSVGSNRTIADLTGGQASAFRTASRALERIDQSTRFSYLLGYQPANSDWKGEYRRIDVKVTRPGVTVLYRHGYYARRQLVPFDRQQFMTYSRIVAAGNYAEPVRDIEITVEASAEKAGGTGVVVVHGTIASPRFVLKQSGDKRVGSVELAIFCGDARGQMLGQAWNTVELEMTEEAYQRFMQKGMRYDARVVVTGQARYVKVVAYDYAADIVGSAITRVK